MSRRTAAALELTTPSELELVIVRKVPAPRELVFAAWTQPHHLKQWWGPDGFTVPHCEIDLRVGGAFRIEMRAPDGTLYPTTGTYQQISPPERLVYAEVFGCLGQPGMSSMVTVSFAEAAGGTQVTIHTLCLSKAHRDALIKVGVEKGWTETFDRLAAYLPRASGGKA